MNEPSLDIFWFKQDYRMKGLTLKVKCSSHIEKSPTAAGLFEISLDYAAAWTLGVDVDVIGTGDGAFDVLPAKAIGIPTKIGRA